MKCFRCGDKAELKDVRNKETGMWSNSWRCAACGPTKPVPDNPHESSIILPCPAYQMMIDDMVKMYGHQYDPATIYNNLHKNDKK
jgi:hypothetical protein